MLYRLISTDNRLESYQYFTFRSYTHLSFQTIRLNNERFSIPEALFHPSDIGIQEMGIPEAIVHAISCTPEGRLYKYVQVQSVLKVKNDKGIATWVT